MLSRNVRDGHIEIIFSGKEVHPAWLRERCNDAASVDKLTGQRLYDPSDIDPDIVVRSVTEPAHGRLLICFSDGHVSEFDVADLQAELALAPGRDDLPAPVLWDSSLSPKPSAHWTERGDAARLRAMAEVFLRYGFIVLHGVPTEPGTVLTVARQFGFPRETNFGTLFDVRSVPDANDLAYTSLPLDPHTDNPYREPVPGVQLLHCLVNETSGGLSTLIDGARVADALRKSDPGAFQLLVETPVQFRFSDAVTEHVRWAPMIELAPDGAVSGVHVSSRLDYVPLLPEPVQSRFYHARRLFDHLLKSPEFELRFLLGAGDLIMFDNRRLLHGRTGFNPKEGLRHLQGCYIDLDGPRSLYRVLSRQVQSRWAGGVA